MLRETNVVVPREESDLIPTVLFDQIVRWMPIVSAGGRIRKDESLKEALVREVKEEVGLKISAYKLINAYSRVFPMRQDITIA